MNTRARRFQATVGAAALSLLTFVPVARSSTTGTTFTLKHAIHHDVLTLPGYIEDPVGFGLANAVRLFTEDQKRCNYTDNTVCLNFTTTYLGTFGSSGDGSLDIESKAEADSVVTATPEFRIKVVRSLFWDNKFKGGATAEGFFAALIAYDSDYTVYAHEFGHMCGLASRTDCEDALMWEDTRGAHDNLQFAEATQINQAFDPCCVRTGTVDCDATGVAGFEGIEAVATADGVNISFNTLWEAYTQSFEVRRLDPVTGEVVYPVGAVSWVPDANHKKYSIVDPIGSDGAVYQIVEHQQPGRGDLKTGPVIAQPASTSGGDGSGYNADSLAAVVAGYDTYTSGDGMEVARDPCTGAALDYAMLCPDSFVTTLGSYASLWGERGVRVRILPYTVADTCFGGFRNFIRWSARHGTGYFLLVGDANDHVMWDDPARWVNWPFYTEYNNQHVPPSQPEKDIIPTFYTAVPDSPQVSWTYSTPYYASDLPYADVDGDSLPDAIVGRLPASSVADVVAYTAKLQTWLSNTNGSLGAGAALLTFAVNHEGVPAWVTAFAKDSLRASFPSWVNVSEGIYASYSSDPVGSRAFSDSIANAAAAGGADVIAMNLNSSYRYRYDGVPWSFGCSYNFPPPVTRRPFVSVALSCGTNDFDETDIEGMCTDSNNQWYIYRYRPLVERLLFDPSRGAIAQIGPTRASFVRGNPLFGMEFLKQLYSPGSTVGRAFLLAQRICMNRYAEYRDLFRSYVLLGDPRLGPNVVTGVATASPAVGVRLSRPAPNPFNPWTRLRFYLERPMPVSITVFDVHGRVVRKLLRESLRSQGWAEVRWDGKNDSGAGVGSGVYFAQLRAGTASAMQRLVLLR